jgi:hypothetical protein
MSDQTLDDNKTLTSTEDAGDAKNAGDNSTKTKSGQHLTDTKPEGDKSAFDKGDSTGFTKEYFQELRDENKRYRLKAKELEEKLNSMSSVQNNQANKSEDLTKKAEEAADLAKKALDKSNKLQGTIEKRLINSELQQIASKEGLIDMDAFKMADLSNVKVSDEGEVVGAKEIIADLKKSKPYLFKEVTTSNKNSGAPPVDANAAEKPTYSNPKELAAAKQKFLASLR